MTGWPRPSWAARLDRLRRGLGPGLDLVVISSAVNIAYLTGFSGSAGLLVCGRDETWLLADGRYEGLLQAAGAEGRLGPVSLERVERSYDEALAALTVRAGARRVGFEAAHVTVQTLTRWQRLADTIEWVAADAGVESQRLIKDEVEQEILRRGGRLISGVARRLADWVRAGRTENDIAADVERALRLAGFSSAAFPTIVASGPNSAYPHARPTDRRLQPGDLVVLDFGGVLDGYCLDLTRMAGIGQVPPEGVALYRAVRAAHHAAVRQVREGAPAADVDAAARSTLRDHGLEAAFLHGTGHGLGLEVHEAPRIGRTGPDATVPLQAGMVCTIEPGAYVAGTGGVRLEDDVIVTTDGCEVLTDAPLDLLIV